MQLARRAKRFSRPERAGKVQPLDEILDQFWVLARVCQTSTRNPCLRAQGLRLFRENPRPGSLRFQKRGRYWRVCFGDGHRASAVAVPEGYLWFWIGAHDEYERLLKGD